MPHLIVNCQKISFGQTLGVSNVLLNLCEALSHVHELTFAVNDREELERSPVAKRVEAIASSILTLDEAKSKRDAFFETALELRPHHFQQRSFCRRSLILCHDLHVFDIPWKYNGHAAAMQDAFRNNVRSADAVFAHFPRTFYDVERIAGVSLMNLFLTASPLMLDTSPAYAQCPPEGGYDLIYPAQLQAHKNHVALIEAAKILVREEVAFRFVCPGSDFSPELSQDLFAQVRAAGVSEYFHFPGRVSDAELIELFARSRGVIVPSLAEGGAYVPLEGIAAGRPVAVNAIPSASMHISAMQGSVHWFDGHSPADTARAARALLAPDAAEVYRKQNRNCREEIRSATWSAVAETWNRVIDMLLSGSNRPQLRINRTGSKVQYV